MSRKSMVSLLSLLAILIFGGQALSQPVRGGWALLGEDETIQATIQEVQQYPGRLPGMVGLRFVVKTDAGESVTVLVGPAYYLSQAGYDPKVGDEITIEGFMIRSDVDALMVARTITSGSLRVTLRDEQGVPLWSGGARFPGRFSPQSKVYDSNLTLARGYGRAGASSMRGPSRTPGMGVRTPQGGQGTGVCPFGYPAGTGINNPTPQGSGVYQGGGPRLPQR